MTDHHVARLYSVAVALLGFFLAWAGIAAHPWKASSADPAAAQLALYEQRLRADAALARQLGAPPTAQPAFPPLRIVPVAPVTTTRSS